MLKLLGILKSQTDHAPSHLRPSRFQLRRSG